MRLPLRKGEVALKPVHPSAGIAALYRQKLFALIDEMQRSYVFRLRAAYRKDEPRTVLAQDADPRAEIERIIKELLAKANESLSVNRTWGSGLITLPDGTQINFFQEVARSNSRGAKRGPNLRGKFKIKMPGEDKFRSINKDAIRTVLEDILAIRSPTQGLEQTLAQLGAQWQRNLNEVAPKLASYFAKAVDQRTQTELKKILRDGGISVRFQMTPAMKDVLQSTIVENVGLIKSIGSQYHTDIQGMVMRSVQTGRDLAGLSKDLRERYGITKRRANLIALNQNNMATSSMMRARQTEAGIDGALWLHSHAGKVPRPTHLANDGERYQISKGWHDPDPKVNKRIWPGQLINCRCVSKPIVKGFS